MMPMTSMIPAAAQQVRSFATPLGELSVRVAGSGPRPVILWPSIFTDSHIYDLRSWFQENAPDVSADIYVSTQNPFDMAHANDLIGFRNIRIHEYEKGGHRLIIHLHQAGLLPEILA